MFGDRIRIFRIYSRLSQKEFAKRIGVTAPTISSWENDITEPTITNLLTMIDMGVNIDFLLYEKGKPAMRICE